MPRVKRVSENQLNKDIYDAGEDDRFAETPDPGQGMSRASQDVIQKRKIVKVSRRKFGGESGTAPPPTAPTMAPASQPAARSSSNPFASTTLAKPSVAFNKGGGESSSKSNPFSNLAFAGASSASKPTFSFTASASTPAPKPASSTLSLSPSNAAVPSSSTAFQPNGSFASKTLLLSTPRSSKGTRNEKIQKLNQNFLHMIVEHWEGRLLSANFSGFMKEYQEHENRLELEECGDGSNETVFNNATLNTSAADVALSSNRTSQPGAKPFSFGASAPAPAPGNILFSFGGSFAPPASGGTFSFTAQPAAATSSNGASTGPDFSFGSFAGANAPSAASSSSGIDNDDDPTSNLDDGKIEKIEQEENTEEVVLLEVRAKHMKVENGAWKKYGAGVLRLYRHKQTSKQRMVIRNGIGKVQFNVGVSKGMKFEKFIKDGKKGKSAFVEFIAVEDASRGPEKFMLQVKPECVDKLHETLRGMV